MMMMMMNQLPEPTAASYLMHKYNWSISTARSLSITLDLGWHLSVRPSIQFARSLSVGVMLKNADTDHYTVAAAAALKGSRRCRHFHAHCKLHSLHANVTHCGNCLTKP